MATVAILGLMTLLCPQEGRLSELNGSPIYYRYEDWKDAKVGAWVAWENSNGGPNYRVEDRFKLVEISDSAVVLEHTQRPLSKNLVLAVTVPLKITLKRGAWADEKPTAEGIEALAVGRKALKCSWKEWQNSENAGTLIRKEWFSDSVPGGHAKQLQSRSKAPGAPAVPEFSFVVSEWGTK
jgi:hypothetical protein